MLNIKIKATNIELTTAIENYVSKKLEAVEKLIDPNDESAMCQVEVGKTTNHHKNGDYFLAEINLHIAGKDLFARSEKDDLYAAIDDVKDQIVTELKRVKEKRTTLVRKGASRIKEIIKGFYRSDE